ncbi:MAG: SPOR domain-containing protein [Spirochaetaceae bacterium]|jgi:cell division septation protein DedD|nr:SPOR domain-containing protein [Spirochaetaceae bacterium]
MVQRRCLVFLLLLFSGRLFSQADPVLLGAEIQSIDRKLHAPETAPAERKQALVRMARLFELSGNAEGAAEAWNQAARAIPGRVEPGALMRGAVFLAAMGEFERARAELAPILAASDRTLAAQARFLHAQFESFRTGETRALGDLLKDPALAEYKPAIYYSMWKISGDTAARNRLTAEFPQSPEARIALDNNPAVTAAPTALWLLMGIQPASRSVSPQETAPRPPSAVETGPAATGSGGPAMLQTGLFSREENARALAERLRGAGFSPLIAKKMVNGKENWAVGVAPGPDPSRTMLLLKDKGFESFPVY